MPSGIPWKAREEVEKIYSRSICGGLEERGRLWGWDERLITKEKTP